MANRPVWFMSNRQAWVQAVMDGLIHAKTRSQLFIPEGAIVILHASTALWNGYKNLEWTAQYDVPKLPRGVICGAAIAERVGLSEFVMEERDYPYFTGKDGSWYAAPYSVRFSHVTPLPMVKCDGRQNPVKKMPQEFWEALKTIPAYEEVMFNLNNQEVNPSMTAEFHGDNPYVTDDYLARIQNNISPQRFETLYKGEFVPPVTPVDSPDHVSEMSERTKPLKLNF